MMRVLVLLLLGATAAVGAQAGVSCAPAAAGSARAPAGHNVGHGSRGSAAHGPCALANPPASRKLLAGRRLTSLLQLGRGAGVTPNVIGPGVSLPYFTAGGQGVSAGWTSAPAGDAAGVDGDSGLPAYQPFVPAAQQAGYTAAPATPRATTTVWVPTPLPVPTLLPVAVDVPNPVDIPNPVPTPVPLPTPVSCPCIAHASPAFRRQHATLTSRPGACADAPIRGCATPRGCAAAC